MKIYTFDLIIDKNDDEQVVYENISRTAVDGYIAWYRKYSNLAGYTIADNYSSGDKLIWNLPW